MIGPSNDQLGIMSSHEALAKAEEANLDLVLIAPQGDPPVCRIMDYGKYRFEQTKKEKEARNNQKQSELKEVRFFLNIDTNDFNRKVSQAIKFLQNGDKVKVKIRFKRARELSHMNLGEDLMKKFIGACSEYGSCDKPSVLEGKTYACVLVPKSAASAKKAQKNPQGAKEPKRESEKPSE